MEGLVLVGDINVGSWVVCGMVNVVKVCRM